MTRRGISPIGWALVMVLCGSAMVCAQVQSIRLPPGKKVVLQGEVRAGNYRERLYTFEAKPGQRLTVALNSTNHNAVFSVNEQYRVDRQAFEEEKTEWSGSLPESDSNGLYSIAVTATKGTAVYTLEIMLAASPSSPSADRVAPAQADQPKDVKDYYLLMPKKYDGATRQEREETLESDETFVDIQHGYMGSQIGKLGERCQAALFKRPDGGFIFAYNEDGDPATNVPTKLFLLKYEAGQWTDVTAQLLPEPVNKRYWYDLPQIGTTIKVTTAKGGKLYHLAWKNGRFEKQ
jgi:hypothetical protein